MVLYKQLAIDAIDDIVVGLTQWGSMPNGKVMTTDHITQYRNRIVAEIHKIPNLRYHALATYRTHTRYGTYVHKYKTNSRTTWYIVYNKYDDDYIIEYITNNYNTISGTLS